MQNKRIRKALYSALALAIGSTMTIGTTGSCKTERKVDDSTTIVKHSSITCNIYVENSGSMAGYCNINDSCALETLVDDYIQRIESSNSNKDSINLFFINEKVEPFTTSGVDFLKAMKSKCTAQYTKLDEMLKSMMESVTDKDVNILISDYVFSTDSGNFTTAGSHITSIFSKQLNSDQDISVAIFKYIRNFNGKYYPGGITCNKPLPVYIWVFGKDANVRKIANLPFNTTNCGQYFLQLSSQPEYSISTTSTRAVTKDHKEILVEEWKQERHKDYYEFEMTVNLSNSILTEKEIRSKSNYKITSSTSSSYEIVEIASNGQDEYTYKIRTPKPSPGILTIQYPITTPGWVSKSNFSGNGLPDDSTTLGIKYLIDGVSKAYRDVSHNKSNYFEININIK